MDAKTIANGAETLIFSWNDSKLFFERSLAFSPDALHVIASVLVQLAAAFVLRKPLSSSWPWFVVFAAALTNEVNDLWIEQWPDAAVQYGEGFKDILLTMFLPTVLMLSTRWLPGLYRKTR